MSQVAVKPYVCIENERTFIAMQADCVRRYDLTHLIDPKTDRMDGAAVYISESRWASVIRPLLDSKEVKIRFERTALAQEASLIAGTCVYDKKDLLYPPVIGSSAVGGEIVDVVRKDDVELAHFAVESPCVVVHTPSGVQYIAFRHLPIADREFKLKLEAELMSPPPAPPSSAPRF